MSPRSFLPAFELWGLCDCLRHLLWDTRYMITQQVLDYIRQQLATGISKEQIGQNLSTQGWSQQDINEAFASIGATTAVPRPPTPPNSPLQKGPQVVTQNNMTASRPIKNNTLLLLGGSAILIAVLMYFGVRVFVPAQMSLFAMLTNAEAAGQSYFLFLLPAVVLGLIFVMISWWWGRRIYKKENRPIQSFFFGTSLYLLLIFLTLEILNVVLVHFANGLPEDGPFVVGLVFSIFFLASIQILYVGLLVCMGLLIFSTRSSTQEPPLLRSKFAIQIRYAVIAITVALALYAFGAIAPVASVLNQQWLCNLVYSSRAKADCFLGTSTTATSENTAAQNSAGSGTFTIVKTDYKQIKDLHDVGGKLAYAFENNDGTSGVVYDGQVVSGAYQKVGILPIAEVGGTLAYEAYKGDKQIIVWNGKEYGEQYDMALSPTDVGGKLAYLAQIGKVRPSIKQIVVWDGKEYGTDFTQTNDIRDIGGKLAFHGRKASSEYIVVGDKQYGPYGSVRWLQEKDGHSIAQVSNGNASFYVVDGVEIGKGFDYLADQYAFVEGKFAFSGSKNKKITIVYDGQEIGSGGASLESGPYNVKGQLAYVAANPDGTSQLIVGGQTVGLKISDPVHNVAVSDGGKVAIETENANKEIVVYLDGKEVYRGQGGNPFGFFGEKLLFWIQENKLSALWYDGKKIGQGFYGYNYFAVVNGKLDIAAFASAAGGVQYSLLLEQ